MENGGASYSLNVAYLAHYRISALKDVINNLTIARGEEGGESGEKGFQELL